MTTVAIRVFTCGWIVVWGHRRIGRHHHRGHSISAMFCCRVIIYRRIRRIPTLRRIETIRRNRRETLLTTSRTGTMIFSTVFTSLAFTILRTSNSSLITLAIVLYTARFLTVTSLLMNFFTTFRTLLFYVSFGIRISNLRTESIRISLLNTFHSSLSFFFIISCISTI